MEEAEHRVVLDVSFLHVQRLGERFLSKYFDTESDVFVLRPIRSWVGVELWSFV